MCSRSLLYATIVLLAAALPAASAVAAAKEPVGARLMISAGPNGEPGNDSSAVVTLSDDGWAVAFVSYASNLVTGDLNGLPDVFVRNLRTWEIERVPFDDDRTSIQNLAVSGNGEVVIFLAQFVGFASGMFKYDTRTGALTELTAVETQPQNNLAATDYFGRPVLFDTSDSLDPQRPRRSRCTATRSPAP